MEIAPEKFPLYLCAVRTGMRRGELIALKRSDIDFERRLIHVQRTFSRGKIKLPKSGRTLSRQLAAVLAELPVEDDDTPLFKSTANTLLASNLSRLSAHSSLTLNSANSASTISAIRSPRSTSKTIRISPISAISSDTPQSK
ncbi:MAG TPA: tyrosine-type recombinase/integrase [Candidatus Binatia bacterium]|nr:tyrosine-type recombinase/integrase [Candidatus Binatia bacterium]